MIDLALILILLLVAALAVFIGFQYITLLERKPQWLITACLLVFLYTSISPDLTLPSISFGGVNVFFYDILAGLALLFSFPKIYFLLKDGFDRLDLPLLLITGFFAVVLINFLAGIREFGLQTSANEFRSYLYYMSVMFYGATIRFTEKDWISFRKLWLFVTYGLFVIAGVGYMDGDLSRAGRPLNSEATLFTLQAGIMLLFVFGNSRQLSIFHYPILIGFLPLILLLQHRSVWVVSLLSLAMAFILLPKIRKSMLQLTAISIVLGVVVLFSLFSEEVIEAIQVSYKEATTMASGKGTSTFMWRVSGWKQFLGGDQLDSFRELILGNPFGTGWSREMVTSSGAVAEINVQPHNFYIQTLLRSGLIGLFLLVWLHIHLLRRFLHFGKSKHGVFDCFAVLVFSLIVFYLVYGSNIAHSLIMGLGVALLRGYQKQAQVEPAVQGRLIKNENPA